LDPARQLAGFNAGETLAPAPASQIPAKIDPYEIGGTKVQLTLLGGREVYRAKEFTG